MIGGIYVCKAEQKCSRAVAEMSLGCSRSFKYVHKWKLGLHEDRNIPYIMLVFLYQFGSTAMAGHDFACTGTAKSVNYCLPRKRNQC